MKGIKNMILMAMYLLFYYYFRSRYRHLKFDDGYIFPSRRLPNAV